MGHALVSLAFASQLLVAPNGTLPAGAQLVARLNTTIGTTRVLGVGRIADESTAGAPFAATVEAPIVDGAGRTLRPTGAVLHGHIVRIAQGQGVRSAVIELAVDRLDRDDVRMHLVGPEVQQMAHGDLCAAADAHAFWGGFMGGLAFNVPGVVLGYGFGGTVGAVKVVHEKTVDGWIAAGTLLTVELEAPLPLAAGQPPSSLVVGESQLFTPPNRPVMVICDDVTVVNIEDVGSALRLTGLRVGETSCSFTSALTPGRREAHRIVVRPKD